MTLYWQQCSIETWSYGRAKIEGRVSEKVATAGTCDELFVVSIATFISTYKRRS